MNILESKNIFLKKASLDDAEYVSKCFSNNGFMDLYRINQKRNLSSEELNFFLESNVESSIEEIGHCEWVIFKKSNPTNVPIGLCNLAGYNSGNYRSEFGLGIENKDLSCYSAALETSILLLDFAFNNLYLNKIISFVYHYNALSIDLTSKLGFLKEGILVDHVNSANGFISLHQYAMFASQFKESANIERYARRFLCKDSNSSLV